MSIVTQNNSKTLQGPAGERPDAVNYPFPGSFWHSDATATIAFLAIVGGVKTWIEIDGSPNGTAQATAPLTINGDNTAHSTGAALVYALTPLVDPVFYVDPVTGNDSNDGTIGSPFATVNHALQALTPGWYGFATINLRAGTNTIGSKTVFPKPLGNSNTSAGGILINGVDNTNSALGTRTSNGGTAGVSQTFGTVIDSVGGLTVNAWRGFFIRFTSGATLNGRSFLIASNSATTFTICGTIPVAPTTETFVVETPAAVVSWSGTQAMQGSCPVGVQNIAFTGGGGSNSFLLSGFVLGQQRCSFASIGSGGIRPRNGAGLTDLVAIQFYLGATSITQQCGSHFNGTQLFLVVGSTTGLGPSQVNLNRCLLNGSSTEVFVAVSLQFINCYFVGNAYVRLGYGSTMLMATCRFDAVTPAPVFSAVISSAFGAAIVFSKRSSGLVSNCDVSNTPATTAPGDAVFVEDSSTIDIPTTTGTGNAGLGCRVNRLSQVRKSLGTTVTGTLGEVKIGANAINTWAGIVAIETDPVELCIGGPNV